MLEHFTDHIKALQPCEDGSPTCRERVLEALKALAQSIDVPASEGEEASTGYVVRLLHADRSGWTLAVVILRPGEATPPHDHEGWGCAATVHGVERNRRLVGTCPDGLELVEEQDFPRGDGYVFNEGEIHQPVGADPKGVTISLHLLVRSFQNQSQRCHETTRRAHTRLHEAG